MDFLTYTQKLEDLQHFIKSGSAVTVDDLGKKLTASRRTILRMVDHLKLRRVPIKYSKSRRAYYIEK